MGNQLGATASCCAPCGGDKPAEAPRGSLTVSRRETGGGGGGGTVRGEGGRWQPLLSVGSVGSESVASLDSSEEEDAPSPMDIDRALAEHAALTQEKERVESRVRAAAAQRMGSADDTPRGYTEVIGEDGDPREQAARAYEALAESYGRAGARSTLRRAAEQAEQTEDGARAQQRGCPRRPAPSPARSGRPWSR